MIGWVNHPRSDGVPTEDGLEVCLGVALFRPGPAVGEGDWNWFAHSTFTIPATRRSTSAIFIVRSLNRLRCLYFLLDDSAMAEPGPLLGTVRLAAMTEVHKVASFMLHVRMTAFAA